MVTLRGQLSPPGPDTKEPRAAQTRACFINLQTVPKCSCRSPAGSRAAAALLNAAFLKLRRGRWRPEPPDHKLQLYPHSSAGTSRPRG